MSEQDLLWEWLGWVLLACGAAVVLAALILWVLCRLSEGGQEGPE